MKIFLFLLVVFNILLAHAEEITFRIIAVSGTPKLVIGRNEYEMVLDEYPVYTATVDVEVPVKYHYKLSGKKESFEREIVANTLNEFFDRKNTVIRHPLLPLAYEESEITKKSKLYDDSSIATIIIEAPQDQIDSLHADPFDEDLKFNNIKVIYATPYTVKVFNKAKISISGQTTRKYSKLSYKLGGLKDDNGDELYGRTSIKLKAEAEDPSMMREKLYLDMADALGIPTSHAKYARVFINKKPVGLFLVTDDLNNSHFLKNTFNLGEKYTVDNHVFKAKSYYSGGVICDLNYYGPSSKNYKGYEYKGDDESSLSNMKKVEQYLVPFLKNIDEYPQTNELNFDIEGFLKAMALEYTAYANDNFWTINTNYFLFNDVEKDYWYFIDSDFDTTLGRGKSLNTALETSLDDFTEELCKKPERPRALIDNIRSKSRNENLLVEAIKKSVKTFFNLAASEPRINSLLELIKEDVKWDLSLERMSRYSKRENKPDYTYNEFLDQCTTTEGNYPMAIKKWIKKKAINIADDYDFSVPSSPDDQLGYYTPKYEGEWENYNYVDPSPTTPVLPTESSSLPTTDGSGKCGVGIAICGRNYCCSKHGYCGTSEKYCGTGCQKKFGRCDNDEDDEESGGENDITVTTNGRCGPNDGSCPAGECCSEDGECGTTDEHCQLSQFCQPEYGVCVKDTGGKCGEDEGNCPLGQCCSKHGHCGTSEKYCGSGCQSDFGRCNVMEI